MMQRLLKLIVVEDDPTLAKLYAEALENDAGITTAQAHTLQEAVTLCQKERQIVLLLDLGIPGAVGVDAVGVLRKVVPGATLVVITGSEELAEPARVAGAHAVIIKGNPDSFGDGLIRTVRQAVVRRDMELLFRPVTNAVEKQQVNIDKANAELTAEMRKK